MSGWSLKWEEGKGKRIERGRRDEVRNTRWQDGRNKWQCTATQPKYKHFYLLTPADMAVNCTYYHILRGRCSSLPPWHPATQWKDILFAGILDHRNAQSGVACFGKTQKTHNITKNTVTLRGKWNGCNKLNCGGLVTFGLKCKTQKVRLWVKNNKKTASAEDRTFIMMNENALFLLLLEAI